MKKKVLFFGIITLFASCSSSETITEEQINSKPIIKLVDESQRKSAVILFQKSSGTSKIGATKKRLKKAITFTASSPFDVKYKTTYTQDQYNALPTDNIYNTKEDTLNLDTKKFDERTFEYNSDGNLVKVTYNCIASPEQNALPGSQPVVYEYTSDGLRKQITRFQDQGMAMRLEYNSIGQIIKAFNVVDDLLYTYEYDESGNLSNKILYMMSPEGIKPQMRYQYTYYPDNSYEKSWISIFNGKETLGSKVKYWYNKNVAGVYANEALHRATMDNQEGLQYLHITQNTAGYKPKYFYDAEGYLIKYDKLGRNDAIDITLFIYE